MFHPARSLLRFGSLTGVSKTAVKRINLFRKSTRVSKMHTLAQLPFDPSGGVPPLLSPKAVDLIYNQQQAQLLTSLNVYLGQISNAEGRSLYDIIMHTSNLPDVGHVFNCASQAWNNDFFLQHLSPKGCPITPLCEKCISQEWGSIENFMDDFKYHALGIFGCGWTWLVCDSYNNLRIINTFNAGSPYIPQYKPGIGTTWQQTEFGGRIPPRTVEYNRYTPLLCLNVWEQAYVPDYGVNGRSEYIDNFWKAVNWRKVSANLPSSLGARMGHYSGFNSAIEETMRRNSRITAS